MRTNSLATRDVWRGAATVQPNAAAGPGTGQELFSESLVIDRRNIPFLTRDSGVLAVALSHADAAGRSLRF
ncbi:hypothetical protein LP420_27405 [Massilia sp. B-10]|nr:hypothetical protein LP420_27405 [Massilia sp. B-10]UUZ52800.1 hypothetical protein LP419_26915 [Massilia sp. H-1]